MTIYQNSLKLFIVMTLLFVISIALNAQLAAIVERKRDIGIFQAIGWSARRILGLMFIESFLQAIIGIGVGCVLSLALLKLPGFILSNAQLNPIEWPVYLFSSLPALAGAAIATSASGYYFLKNEPFFNLYQTA